MKHIGTRFFSLAASLAQPLERFPSVAKFVTGGSAVEPPFDLDAVAVHAAIPHPAFPEQRLEIRDSSSGSATRISAGEAFTSQLALKIVL